MGLDMTLEKRTYVKNWSHMKPDALHTVAISGPQAATIKPPRISHIIEEVAVWRKANAIHKWFVDNVQEGNDDCKDYYVSTEQLTKLLQLCDHVLAVSKLKKGKIQNGTRYANGVESPVMEDGEYVEDPTMAKQLLPTNIDGCFFGSDQYDEYYIADIKYTADTLRALLAEPEAGFGPAYYYSSSW